MTGETNLDRLISSLEPQLSAAHFMFVSFGPQNPPPVSLICQAWAMIREDEGQTLILDENLAISSRVAEAGPNLPRFRRITLSVHSSLEAVGLTAAISTALAQAGISANVVAAFHHDHVFVPAARAEEALKILKNLSCRT